MSEHAQFLIDPSYLPDLAVLASAFVVLDVAAICLTIFVHERRLLRCRREYIKTVEEKHRRTLEFQAHQAVREILDDLLGSQGSTSPGDIANEIRRLEMLNASIEQTVRNLREPFSIPSSSIARSILDHLKITRETRIKMVRSSPKDEIQNFIREGFLGWRTLPADQLTKPCSTFQKKDFRIFAIFESMISSLKIPMKTGSANYSTTCTMSRLDFLK